MSENSILFNKQIYVVSESETGKRVDKFLSDKVRSLSRAYIQSLIKGGHVTIDGATCKRNTPVREFQSVMMEVALPADFSPAPEDIALNILYEDEDLVVVNKPSGLVVHPAPGHFEGTLVNALMNHCGTLSDMAGPLRLGIVHRLDKDTSGAMVVAKHNQAHDALALQFRERSELLIKEYIAISEGEFRFDADTIDLPLGRHFRDKKKIAVVFGGGKESISRYQVLERFKNFTFTQVRLKTGRTHQIRVHLKALGHPVICDGYYGNRNRLRVRDLVPEKNRAAMTDYQLNRILIARQALHAHRLQFEHPTTGELIDVRADYPKDISETLKALREWATLESES